MKKLPVLLYALAAITVFSCRHRGNGNTDINYRESGRYYSMKAYFGKSQTRDVEKYMDKRIGRKSNISFTNMQSDAKFTLDDHTTFYMIKTPGHIEIKLDKAENSDEAYHRIKSMCEGIKEVLTK